MELWAPRYLKNFKCLASDCPHTCCAGWVIDVDPDTLERYKALGGYFTDSLSEEGSFVLTEGDRCPHLTDKGLCRIISDHGEGYLCDICREHPRFYTYAPDRAEMGVGMSCYAAASLILDSEYEVVPVGNREGECTDGLDTVSLREQIYSILGSKSLPYEKRLRDICGAVNIDPLGLGEDFYRDIFDSVEYLYPENAEKFRVFSPSPDTPEGLQGMLEKALAYFILRHCTEAVDMDDYRARLCYCLLCERLFCSLLKHFPDADPITLACTVSEELEYSTENEEFITDAFYSALTLWQ